jgi:hypothetical protein
MKKPHISSARLELLRLDQDNSKNQDEIKLLQRQVANARKRQMAYLRSLTLAELQRHLELLLERAAQQDDKSAYEIAISEARLQLENRTRQDELERIKKQKQSEYRFEHEFRELYSIADIPDGEWFGTDRNGAPTSNAKNIALALKRLPLCKVTFDELGNCSIIYNNYPIRLENAPIFFSHVIRDAFRFITKRDQFKRALRLLRN